MNLIRTFCARFGACKPDAAERVEASEPVRLGRENRSLIHEIRAILEDRTGGMSGPSDNWIADDLAGRDRRAR
jgi:hypothetical protein